MAFLKRIKSHYQEFTVDDFKVDEWYKELKDYDFDDINRKLESHLRSEEYGSAIPKVHFLTKWLKKSKDKGKVFSYEVNCPICKKWLDKDEFNRHYDRCSSINYLNKQSLKYKGEEIDKEIYLNLSYEDFNKKYDAICEYVYKHTEDEDEKKYLRNYLNSKYGGKIEPLELNL